MEPTQPQDSAPPATAPAEDAPVLEASALEAPPPETAPPDSPRPGASAPPRKGSALRRQLATQRADSSLRWTASLRRRLSLALTLVALGVGAFFGLRKPALRALAGGEGELAAWAADQLVQLRDPGSFEVYVHQLGLREERETFAVLVYGLAGRDALPADEDAPLPPPSADAEAAHRRVILEALARDDDAGWQRGAIYALLTLHERSWLVDDEALQQAAKLLAHADPVIRRWASMLLAWSAPPPGAQGSLVRAALPGEPDPRVRRYAVQALGRTRLEEHRPTLMRALSDDAAEVRREATLALSYLEGPAPLDELEAMLRDSRPGQRPEVLTAIANDPGARATRLLVVALGAADAHADTQITCARLLAQRRGPEPVEALVAALGSGDPSVRIVAAQGLAARDDATGAVSALVAAFAARVERASAGQASVEAWNELLALQEALRTLTGRDAPTLTEAPASWEAALAAWTEATR